VFAGEVKKRTEADPRVRKLGAAIERADVVQAAHLRIELSELRAAVRAEKIAEVASEFDSVHTIERAQRVGSVHAIVAAARLRPELVAAIERGVARMTSSEVLAAADQ
jgi:hypothetical protein